MDWEDLQGFEGTPDWFDQAACKDHDTDAFFTDSRRNEALTVCAECEVQTDCFVFAVETGSSGVWGRTTTTLRNEMLAEHGLETPARNKVQIQIT